MGVRDVWTKRDGTPSARHGIGGRWRVEHPRYSTEHYSDRRDAEIRWADMLRDDREHKDTPPSATVGELLDQWLAGKAGLRPSSRLACEVTRRSLLPHWGSVPAADVRPHEVRTWIAALTTGTSRQASVSTRRKALQALRGAFEIGVERGILHDNPASKITIPRGQPRRRWYLRPSELRDLADAAAPYQAAVLLMGTTGLRISEMVALNVGDVDAQRRRLLVRQSKTGASREVPISATMLGMLDLGRGDGQPLICTSTGVRVHGGNWRRRVFAPAAAAIGCEGMTPHDLRHTAASLAIASGADAKVVQRMLGHASAAMTLDLYGHLWDERLDDVAQAMDSAVWESASVHAGVQNGAG